MTTQYDLNENAGRLVYVKPVAVADLPQDVRDQAPDVETVYSVHNSDGEQLALVADWDLAFTLAQQNDFSAVPVH